MSESRDAQLAAGLGHAGATIGAAIAGTKPDHEFYDNMNQMSRSKVADLMAMRRAKADETALANAQMKQEKEQALLDPGSPNSVAFRKVIETSFPSISKAYGDSWKSVSASDKDLLFQPIQLKEQLDARKQAAVIKTLEDPKVSEEQKISQGRQLLKTLNSTEGADAIGKEESERLGSFLNFHFMNLTQPGPVFGRDIGAFAEQAKLTSHAVKNAIQSNKKNISQLYQSSGVVRQDSGGDDWESKKLKAIEWVRQNPNDPKAKEIMRRLKLDVQS